MLEILYLTTGVIAGLLAGLLGVGGGIIIVPILNILLAEHFSSVVSMHVAVGSSLAIMVFTALSSSYAYYRRDLIIWPLFYQSAPGLILGVTTGSFIAMYLSSRSLLIAFSIFILFVALDMLLSREVKAQRDLPGLLSFNCLAFVIGIFSGFFGIGGGVLMVPLLVYCNVEMHKATGTSALCGLSIAAAGAICFILTGSHVTGSIQLPYGTTGYIYWPAVIPIALTSVLFAPIGTRLAVWLPAQSLKRIFGVILILTSALLLLK